MNWVIVNTVTGKYLSSELKSKGDYKGIATIAFTQQYHAEVYRSAYSTIQGIPLTELRVTQVGIPGLFWVIQ